MEELLPELLDQILATCADYAPALGAVCRRWWTAAERLPAKISSAGNGLTFLARGGHAHLLEYVLECRGRPWVGPARSTHAARSPLAD